MHPLQPQANLQYPAINQPKKTFDQLAKLIAIHFGQSAQSIYSDIEKYKQKNRNLQKYELSQLSFKKYPTQSNVCAKILARKTKAFKCYDCIFQNNSILCVECFEASDHKGHLYQVIQVHGGCCDCGDEEKWDPKGFCKHHNSSNLVQEMKDKVNNGYKELQNKFISDLGFCFALFFAIYNEAQIHLIENKNQPAQQDEQDLQNEYQKKIKQAQDFGTALLGYLNNFNKNSLISNIMTFNLLSSKLQIKDFQLIFCQNLVQKPIYQILFQTIKLPECVRMSVDLFTHLFTLRQFRRMLTKSFIKLHQVNPDFAMSEFNHLSCQLLTSHKMIAELVQAKEIPPLTYKPSKQKNNSFEVIAHNFVRYYIDIDYLASLYKGSSQTYLQYHIMQGEFPCLGYYKNLSFEMQESLNYYGIQDIRFTRVIKILKVVMECPQPLIVLQKAIKDLWAASHELYKTWNQDLFNQATYEDASIRNIYLTHELTWATSVFAYFQKLKQKQPYISEQDKIYRLIQILSLNKKDSCGIQKVKEMIEVLNNNLIFSGLTLGHPQTMDRFYTYYSFTFKKSLSTLVSALYMYKILINMLNLLQTQSNSKTQPKNPYFVSDQFIFERPLKLVENILNSKQFADDDQSIFDRVKIMIRLTYFLHLLIQASQTDIHEIIMASFFDFIPIQKYQKKVHNFYIQLLKNYKKIPLKEFKKVADSFFQNNAVFQKFISTCKQISIEHGKILLKNYQLNTKIQNEKSQQDKNKIESDLNDFYFKSFKGKLANFVEHEYIFKLPQSSNHFLYQILSKQFIERLLQVLLGYIEILTIKGGDIKQKQAGALGLFVIEIIKIEKALRHDTNYQMRQKIAEFFKRLRQNKTSLSIFNQEVVKIICTNEEQNSNQIRESLSDLNKETQIIVQERKRKSQEKKAKILAKFKENQEKFEDAYALELQRIKNEMTKQEEVKVQVSIDAGKFCIICKQSHEIESYEWSLMLMGFMQLSDVYEYILKGKHRESQNCHLVFKTCGHHIHQQCYEKINKNRQYTICQLCKSPVNCLFPMGPMIELKDKTLKPSKQLFGKTIYRNLSVSYSLLYALDDSLRSDCQNAFDEKLSDKLDFKDKLIDSLAIQILFSGIVNKQRSSDFFQKNQFQIYQNILHGLIFFCRSQQDELQKPNNTNKIESHQIERQKTQMDKITSEKNALEDKIKDETNQGRIELLKTVETAQSYIRKSIWKIVYGERHLKIEKQFELSKEFVEIIDQILRDLAQLNFEKKQPNKSTIIEEQSKNCKQIEMMKPNIRLYRPPTQLQKLIEIRGKCANCNLLTNHIFVCLICEWKGCKNCKSQSVYRHTAKKHAGNSIFIEANNGNVYLVTKSKHWIYNSFYTNYLQESFMGYVNGIKLDKYSLSEKRWENFVYRIVLGYDIDTKIRYEEYNNKRAFNQII